MYILCIYMIGMHVVSWTLQTELQCYTMMSSVSYLLFATRLGLLLLAGLSGCKAFLRTTSCASLYWTAIGNRENENGDVKESPDMGWRLHTGKTSSSSEPPSSSVEISSPLSASEGLSVTISEVVRMPLGFPASKLSTISGFMGIRMLFCCCCCCEDFLMSSMGSSLLGPSKGLRRTGAGCFEVLVNFVPRPAESRRGSAWFIELLEFLSMIGICPVKLVFVCSTVTLGLLEIGLNNLAEVTLDDACRLWLGFDWTLVVSSCCEGIVCNGCLPLGYRDGAAVVDSLLSVFSSICRVSTGFPMSLLLWLIDRRRWSVGLRVFLTTFRPILLA